MQKAEAPTWPGGKTWCQVMAASVIIGTGINKLA